MNKTDISAADIPVCLDGVWRLAYEENCVCKDYADEIHTIADLNVRGFTDIPANVPGNFEPELYKAGIIEDPFFGTNTLKMQELENRHVWYYTEFNVDSPDGSEYLRFDGIDTIADVYVNSECVLHADNMYISHETGPLKLNDGRNELLVHIKPALIEARKYELPPVCNAQDYAYESLYIRKAPHMYGWDIMPRIVSCGIWKSVFLMKRKKDRIDDAFIYATSVDTEAKTAYASVFFYLNVSRDLLMDYSLEAEGTCGESRFYFKKRLWHTQGIFRFGIENCRFWWPKNAGAQDMYDTTLRLYYKDELCDTYKVNFGVRTVQLDRTNVTDESGSGEFCFRINGRKIFAMGSNWVPVDAFHSNDINRLPRALEMLDDIGCNITRCWGGNVYENDYFFDFCDRHGIMVWQDFAMGCAVYPQEERFYKMLEKEAVSVIKRLRNHPSLILWAGDNEGDYAYQDWGGIRRDPDKNVVTREVLARICAAHDFTRPYLPSSPYMTSESFRDGKPTSEDHLWGPRDYFKGSYYNTTVCHFASETGYHGCPSPDSLKKFISDDELWPCFKENGLPKDEWEVHSSCMELLPDVAYSYRIRLMADQVKTLFGKTEADDLENFARQSQISQAEAKKFFIERFRSSKWRRTGIIWWNLIDGWPQISDAVVDYYYTRKLAYHFIKRSQEPICLMFKEPENGFISLMGVNDTRADTDVSFTVTNLTEGGRTVLSGDALIHSDSAERIGEVKIKDGEKCFYLIEWTLNGKKYKNHYFTNIIDIDYDSYTDALRKAGMYEFEGFDGV